MYKYIGDTWKDIFKLSKHRLRYREKRMELRRQKTVERIPNPSRLDRANSLGYKAKTGFVVVQVKVSRGGLRKIRPSLGRRQKRVGISKIKRGKSIKTIAEERALRKYRNLRVLGSYFIGEDGSHKWIEVILANPIIT